MRLLKRQKDGSFCLIDTLLDEHVAAQPYAILSHRWGRPGEEVIFEDIQGGTGKEKLGYRKIEFCAEQARRDGLKYFWIDSCCIKKSSDAELSEAINSMFDWYGRAARCYVYLSDVSVGNAEASNSTPTWDRAFRQSVWHLRGWTLQELLAPKSVEFFSQEGKWLGDKLSFSQTVHEVTGIHLSALRGTPVSQFSVEERFDWAQKRTTTRGEDWAYSLLGIFGVSMPAIYGEGKEKAVARLKTVIKATYDIDLGYQGHFADSLRAPVRVYVPRPDLTDLIRLQLWDSHVDTSTRTVVVWGLGGVGKTQLVLDYVQQYGKDYEASFWIEAEEKQTLNRDLTNLYYTLYGLRHVPGQETIAMETVVLAVKRWFAGRKGPWLLVFDGADSIEDSEADDYVDIKHLIPNAASLHVIVTSRSRTAKDIAPSEGVHVSDMQKDQAIELFFRYAQLPREHSAIAEVEAIVKELGYLALAVTLAATYIGTTPRLQSDIQAYLPEYRQRRRDLLRRKPDHIKHQYHESVLTTWESSYQAIAEGNCPDASDLMTMLCFLSSDDVFLKLFVPYLEVTVKRSPLSMNVYKMEDCFRELEKYCFVQWNTETKSFAMHKMVHAWGFDRLDESERLTFSVASLDLIVKAIAACGERPDGKLRLMPHVMASFDTLTRSALPSQDTGERAVDKVDSIADFASIIGRLPEARTLKEFVLRARMESFGEEHLSTLDAMGKLAMTLGHQGYLLEAAQMQKEVLQKRQQILGKDHPDTIRSGIELSFALGSQGHFAEAYQMQKELQERCKRIFGEEDPDTMVTAMSLSLSLACQGHCSEAAQMQKELLEKSKRILGEEAPSTILIMESLSLTLGNQGHLLEAARMQRVVIEKRKQVFGDEHMRTIGAMDRLAWILGKQGRFSEAISILEDTVPKMQGQVSDQSPDLGWAIRNLRAFTKLQSNNAKVENLSERSLPEKSSGITDGSLPESPSRSTKASLYHRLIVKFRRNG